MRRGRFTGVFSRRTPRSIPGIAFLKTGERRSISGARVVQKAVFIYNLVMENKKRESAVIELPALALIAAMICALTALLIALFALKNVAGENGGNNPNAAEASAPSPSPSEDVQAEVPPLSTPSEPTQTPKPVISDESDSFSLIWLTDTQYYSSDYPFICREMTQWIANHIDDLRIKYVFFTGDFVDGRTEAQWNEAVKAMSVLDEAVPWICIAGNHDVGTSAPDYTGYLKRFGEEHFDALAKTDSGYYKNGVGRYDLFSAGGEDYIVAGLGYKAADEEGIRWLDSVLDRFSDRRAILLFHEYIDTDGTLLAAGETLREEIVQKHKNVRLMLCGHRYASREVEDEFDDDGDGKPDRTVYQILGNYQSVGNGGQGYLRILKVYDDRIEMGAYSPYLEDYNWTDGWQEPQPESLTLDISGW